MDFDFYHDECLQTEHLFMVKRVCRVCGEEKDLVTDFYRCRKDPTLESSYAYECKSCAIMRNKNNYYSGKYYRFSYLHRGFKNNMMKRFWFG